MKQLGVIFIVVGILLTVYTAVTFYTNEKVLDLGDIEITREEPHTVLWSPIIGIAVMVIGAAVLWFSSQKGK
jgi:uncharacterized membrane protein YidH (DUF202 family)